MKPIRTAVVGLNMGLYHAHAFSKAERAELTYVVDLDEDKAAKLAAELGCKYATDWTKIIDEIDAVSFCTPHHLHAAQALQAIQAGKHVLIEKPLANSEEECLQLIQAAEEHHVKLMLAFVVRYLPAVRKLKEVLDSGVYGQPIHAQGYQLGLLPPMPPQSWFSRKETLGGGVLFSHGCHYIDILLWLFGEPDRVQSMGTRLGTDWLEGEGTAHSTIQFKSGVLGLLVCSWGTKVSQSPGKYHVHTTDALLELSNDMWKLEAVKKEGKEWVRELLYGGPEDDKPIPGGNVRYEINHFLDAITNDTTPETDGRDALLSHRTIWAMYKSEGVPVG
jgi:predicted dehydrogenase